MATILAGFTLAKPASAPTATADVVSGSLDTEANYNYKVTYVTQFGETDGSAAGAVTTTTTGSVRLTAIPTSPNTNVIARRIYRTIGGGTSYLLLTQIDDNMTTTYSDLTADGSLTTAIPTLNTASSIQTVEGTIRMSKPILHSIERAITATGTTIADAYQLSAEYNWISTAAASTGVRLPELNSNQIGQRIKIKNNGASTVSIYPFTGQSINGGSVGSAITLSAAASTELVADLATNWAQA